MVGGISFNGSGMSRGLPEKVIDFPAEYGIKIMGANQARFVNRVKTILAEQLGDSRAVEYSTRDSRNGKYVSVTCTFVAISRHELDEIYAAMRTDPRVLVVL